jgi:hypothetical protein
MRNRAPGSQDRDPMRLVDGHHADRNHHYMSTRREYPEATGTAAAAASGDGGGDGGEDISAGDGDGNSAGDGDGNSAAEDDADTAGDTGADADTGEAATHLSAGAKVRAWVASRLPAGWFEAPPYIQVDREEITIIGTLPDPAGDSEAEQAVAAQAIIRRFREETRNRRIEIAREAEHRFRRKVSWGATCGPLTEMFTTLSVPVMTRLRQSERRVLDTLVDAGVARSRSDALAWCVRLTGENADEWLSRLREALRHVEEVRDQGP